MASNSFGHNFKFTSFGESHGKAIGCIIDGVPPLIPINEKDIQVYQSHSYEIAKLGSQLQNFAKSNTCQYEIIKHESLPIFGTQFHPEMSEGGQKVIEAFIGL